MDLDEALLLLTYGGPEHIGEWNDRRDDGEKTPTLAGMHLEQSDLAGANLAGMDLTDAYLEGARSLSDFTLPERADGDGCCCCAGWS